MPHAKTPRCRSTIAPLLVSLLAAFTALAAGAVRAATTMGGKEVLVAPHEVIEDDLVVWGDYVRIDGVVKGDLVAIGQEVVVEGIVEGDLLALGKTVYLNGAANDDARIAAYAIALGDDARVADDFFGLCYSLETRPGSRVGGSLYAASRQALLSGQVAESVRVRAGALELRGITGTDAELVVGGLEGVTVSSLVIDLALDLPDVTDGLKIASGARIGGDLEYRAERDATIEPGAAIDGRRVRVPWREQPSHRAQPGPPGDEPAPSGRDSRAHDALRRLAVLVALGLVLVVVAPGWALRRSSEIRRKPVSALGWGLGALVFTAMASLVILCVCALLLVVFGGGAPGLALWIAVAGLLLQAALLAPFLLGLIYLAPVLASLAVGRFVLEKLASGRARTRSDPARVAVAVCVGTLVYASLRAAPGIGVLVGCFGSLVGLGALASWLRGVQLGRVG